MRRSTRRPAVLFATIGALLAAALTIPASAAAAPVPLAQVGSGGVGAGQFTSPFGVALDGSGNVYVAEGLNNRISVFSATGAFTHAFGFGVLTGGTAFEVCTTASGCQAGTPGAGAGQLDFPLGVTVDSSGNLYVTENDNHRISVFSGAATAPSFTRAFGFGVDTGAAAFQVCTTASTCQAGAPGGGAGQLNLPSGVALDDSGNLHVADTENNRISVFGGAATAPSFTRAFGFGVNTGAAVFEICTTASTCQVGLFGEAAGQLDFPLGVAIDGSDNLTVSDSGNHRISVFGGAGTAPSFSRAFGFGVDTGVAAFQVCTTASTCQVGTPGGGAGQLNIPSGVALDGSGNLHVADTENHRVSVFGGVATAPSFTGAFGFGVDTGAAAFQVCTTASTCQAGTPGDGVGQLNFPQGLAVDCRGAAWIADTTNQRLQRFGEPGTALPPCSPAPPTPPGTTPPAGGPAGDKPGFKLGPAIKKCKKKFEKGPKRQKCIKKAKAKAKKGA